MTKKPANLGELKELLARAGVLPPDGDELIAIGNSNIKPQFLDALMNTLNGQDSTGEYHAFLRGVCMACSKKTRTQLVAIGADITLENLATIGGELGESFLVSVEDACSNSDTREESFDYVLSILSGYIDTRHLALPSPCNNASPATQQDMRHPHGSISSTAPHQSAPQNISTIDVVESRSNPSRQRPIPTKPRSYSVFGSSYAICWNECTTKSGDPTVSIDAARVIETPQGRLNDWANKISIQLSIAELPLVLAVLKRKTHRVDVRGHGEKNDKSFNIEDQKGKWFVSVKQGKEARGVPVLPGDAFWLAAMVLKQIMANNPALNNQTISDLLELVASSANEANAHSR